MANVDVYKAIAKYYVRLKLEKASKLAYRKGDEISYKKYQEKLAKLK